MVTPHNDTRTFLTSGQPSRNLDVLGLDVPEWMSRGVCAQTDPEAFFPEKGGSTREAKRICADCPVMAECLDYALKNEERFGIWGGKSERERRRLQRLLAGTALGDVAPRICALPECELEIPIDAHRNQKYCTPTHAHRAAARTYKHGTPRLIPA